jgi:hypothetical protein
MAQVLLNIRLNNMLIKLFLYLTSPAQQHDPKSAFQCQHTQHIFWKNLGIARICYSDFGGLEIDGETSTHRLTRVSPG